MRRGMVVSHHIRLLLTADHLFDELPEPDGEPARSLNRQQLKWHLQTWAFSYGNAGSRESMELRAAPAGGRRHSGEVWFSERQASRIVGQHRGSQRYTTIVRADEDAL